MPRDGIVGVETGRGSTGGAIGCHDASVEVAGIIELGAVDRREGRAEVGGIVIGCLGSIIVVPFLSSRERCASYPEV